MMNKDAKDSHTNPAYLSGQYGTANNLNARVSLHDRYSTNPYGWFRWVFDQYDLPPGARVLELGCGPGYLWTHNRARIPAGWQVTLSDFSPGMVQQAQANLPGLPNFSFQVVDCNTLPLPFADASFDAVIANHMLYHIAARQALLADIRRVLKPGAKLYATTIGARHLAEVDGYLTQINPSLAGWARVADQFTLENGPEQLSVSFTGVVVRRYADSLEVTDLAPLLDYIHSGWAELTPEQEPRLRALLEAEMARQGGKIHISKDSGVLIAARQ